MKSYEKIASNDLQALALGSGILGSGGGGNPSLLLLIAQHIFQNKKPVRLIKVQDLQPDDVVVPVAYIGAPLILQEKLPHGREFVPILEQIKQRFCGKNIILMAAEIGGANGLTPFIVAQQLDLPVLDADGMGRAFPELQMCSFFLHGIEVTPAFMASRSGITVAITTEKAGQNIEKIARDITISFGSDAVMAIYLMQGAQVQKATVANSVSQALAIGKSILLARSENKDPVQALCAKTGATIIALGIIVAIEQKIEQGFLKGTVTIHTRSKKTCVVKYQNENLVAAIDDIIVVTTPDILAIVNAQTGEAITSDALRFGLEVAVIVIAAPALWTTPEGLKLVGPHYFGYNITYQPYKGIAL